MFISFSIGKVRCFSLSARFERPVVLIQHQEETVGLTVKSSVCNIVSSVGKGHCVQCSGEKAQHIPPETYPPRQSNQR